MMPGTTSPRLVPPVGNATLAATTLQNFLFYVELSERLNFFAKLTALRRLFRSRTVNVVNALREAAFNVISFPSWKGQSADPEEKRGPCGDIELSNPESGLKGDLS
jgi:hypothetical protein